jgi:hypothetical protein
MAASATGDEEGAAPSHAVIRRAPQADTPSRRFITRLSKTYEEETAKTAKTAKTAEKTAEKTSGSACSAVSAVSSDPS